MMKFRSAAFGSRLPLDEVTEVVPRLVTPPVTVWVRLVLSAPEVVAAMSVEWVWVDAPALADPVCVRLVTVRLGVPDVVAAGFVECVWSPCVETAIVSAWPWAMSVVCVWVFAVFGAKVPVLLDAALIVAEPAMNRSRRSGTLNVPPGVPPSRAPRSG